MVVETRDEIRALSVEYWLEDEGPQSSIQSARIVGLCDNIPDLYIELFESKPGAIDRMNNTLNELSEIVTGGSFQQSNRTADTSLIHEIEMKVMSLKVALRTGRAQLSYPLR